MGWPMRFYCQPKAPWFWVWGQGLTISCSCSKKFPKELFKKNSLNFADIKTESLEFVNGNNGGHLSFSYLFNSTRVILFIELSFCPSDDLTNKLQYNIFLVPLTGNIAENNSNYHHFAQQEGKMIEKYPS